MATAITIAFGGGFIGGMLQNYITTGTEFNLGLGTLYGLYYGFWNIIGLSGASIGAILEKDCILIAQLWNIFVSGTSSIIQGAIDYKVFNIGNNKDTSINGCLAFYMVGEN